VLATLDLDVAEGLFDEVVFIRDGRRVDARGGIAALRATYREAMEKARG
jgi:hypothetical protein